MFQRMSVAVAALVLCASSFAQVNTKGTLQFGLGVSFGAHATRFDSEVSFLGLSIKNSDSDGAVTVTVPIEAQYGLSDRFSVGLYLEPGSYVDSAGTHPNKLFLMGISPRYYAVNKDRFALYFNADLGLSQLRISDVKNGINRFTDTYSGANLRLGTAVQFYFGQAIGLHLGLKYAANNFNWRARDPRDPILDAVDYSATLKTSGVQFEIGLQAKF